MRRFADDDELDLVIVGCGAGGATLLQRLARAGWKVVGARRRPVLGSRRRLGQRRAGSHRLYWTEPRVIAGADPVPLGSNNSGRGVGGSMVHFAGYTPRFHPSDFRTYRSTASAPTGRSATRTCGRTTKHSKRSCRSPARTGRGATRTATRYSPQPVGGNGEIFLRGAAAAGIEPGSGRSPSPTAGSGTGPTASTGGSASRAARSTPRPPR